MPTKFGHIPLEELYKDWLASHNDIIFCELAKTVGVTSYFDGTKSVQERIDGNARIIEAIEQEMKDRGLPMDDWVRPTVL